MIWLEDYPNVRETLEVVSYVLALALALSPAAIWYWLL